MKQYDAIIIGFGKGGKLLAAELANRNWKVAIIERSPQMYGGTCVNVGCIPTKALIYESVSPIRSTAACTCRCNTAEIKKAL